MTAVPSILETVRDVIRLHAGAARAITGNELAGFVRMRYPKLAPRTAKRRVQEAIAELRTDGVMVLSASHEGEAGYFLAVSGAEVRRWLRELEKKAETDAKNRRLARKWIARLEGRAQLELIAS